MSDGRALALPQPAVLTGAFGGFALLAAGLVAVAWESLAWMVSHEWFGGEDYSHAALVPLISAYLVRQRIDAFATASRDPKIGIALLAVGLVLVLVGNLSTIHTLAQYGFTIALIGAFGVAFGRETLTRCSAPLAVLFLMIPLPNFFYQPLSSELQLLSSQLGVLIVRGLGISVYLHGNVIDLGAYQLQVLDACSGLRYLFPLMSLGCLFAFLYKGPRWQRWLLFGSTVPIAIALNSLRIAAIAIAVEHFGVGVAEGLIHLVEGWAVFLLCVAVLLIETRMLVRASGHRGRLRDAFATAVPPPPAGVFSLPLPAPGAFAVAVTLCAAALALDATCFRGVTSVPLARQSFVEFPMHIDPDWLGRRDALEPRYLDALDLDDYLLADYSNADGVHVAAYVAFYRSQLAGRAVHSPRSCLPGDGWEFASLETIELRDPVSGALVPVNRAVIARGGASQLVYYWFDQRGRVLANEYLVKWYIFSDAFRASRTDGALVRLSTPVADGASVEKADATLTAFFTELKRRLPRFVPGANPWS